MESGAVGEVALLEQHNVPPAHLGKVVGDARPAYTAADDDHPRFALQASCLLAMSRVRVAIDAYLTILPL
jgi:hypothetical protein